MEKIEQVNDKKQLQIGDKYLFCIYIALCIISLVESYSAARREISLD